MKKTNAVVAALAVLSLTATGAGRQSGVPTPESVLGFRVGADFQLATYEESLDYFRRLDAASDHLQLVEVGTTSEGRRWWMALVSSPDNLADVERYRQISVRLAHPDGLTDDEARRMAAAGKAIVHIDGGLHASEVAHAQHTIQLAHDLIAGADDPEIAAILDDVVLMLWPSVNPDGQNMVVEWYRSNVGTPYEVAPMVRLYQKYLGHDNNRDAYMLNMIESRVIARTWRQWEPQIVYVQHQSSPFPTRIWLPPFAEPIAPQVHPLASRTVNLIGMAIAQALEERGQVGAVHMGTGFDAWYPGYIDYLPMLKGTAAYWTETALYRYATPHFYTLQDFPQGRRELRPESLYSSPWPGGWWRLRDAVEYMLTASIATLDFAAKYKDDLLYNRYQASRDTIRKYREGPPYAYFVPREQRDPVAAVELLRRLAFNGVAVHELTADTVHDGVGWPAGTWVVPMDQEFAELARQLLDVQDYPDLRDYPEGPPEQPYDAAGWTLSMQMGVRVVEARSPLAAETRRLMQPARGEAVDWRRHAEGVSMAPSHEGPAVPDGPDIAPFDSVPGLGFDTDANAAGIVPPIGRASGSGPTLAVSPAQNNAFRAVNRAWDAGARVRFEPGGRGAGEEVRGGPGGQAGGGRGGDGSSASALGDLAGGRFLISGLDSAAADELVTTLALRAERTRDPEAGVPMRRPRLGLYRPWPPSMDEGWTRWLLEQYGFDFVNLRDGDLVAGPLLDRFDVIVLPDASPRQLLNGYGKGTVPPRWVGGIGEQGVRALDAFVGGGGTLVCLNSSSDFTIEHLALPVENVAAELARDEFFVGASILEVVTDPAHPLMAGMPSRADVFFDRSPVFTTTEGFEGAALAKYPAAGSPLASGYLLGEEHLHGHAAALEVRHGDGRVVLIGFRPQWRGQPFGTFRVLFNAALFAGEVAATARGTPGFWSPPSGEEPSGPGR